MIFDLVSSSRLQVIGQSFEGKPEGSRGKIGHACFCQNQKTAVLHNQPESPGPLPGRPSQMVFRSASRSLNSSTPNTEKTIQISKLFSHHRLAGVSAI